MRKGSLSYTWLVSFSSFMMNEVITSDEKIELKLPRLLQYH